MWMFLEETLSVLRAEFVPSKPAEPSQLSVPILYKQQLKELYSFYASIPIDASSSDTNSIASSKNELTVFL